jgi:hypothetical protein
MDEKRSVQRKNKHKRRIGRSHFEQYCPHKARTPRRSQESYMFVAKRVEKCIEVDGGISEHLL